MSQPFRSLTHSTNFPQIPQLTEKLHQLVTKICAADQAPTNECGTNICHVFKSLAKRMCLWNHKQCVKEFFSSDVVVTRTRSTFKRRFRAIKFQSEVLFFFGNFNWSHFISFRVMQARCLLDLNATFMWNLTRISRTAMKHDWEEISVSQTVDKMCN